MPKYSTMQAGLAPLMDPGTRPSVTHAAPGPSTSCGAPEGVSPRIMKDILAKEEKVLYSPDNPHR